MNSLQECVNEYIKSGYTSNYAISKVCQDIIINRIYNSEYKNKITLKGGVVMFHLTKNIRRATIDIDMDFINMSIATKNLVDIFIELGKMDHIDNFKLRIDNDKIEELSHQDYHGKRLTVRISDNYNIEYKVKLDIGVHKHTDILQDTLLLDTKIIDGNISFLANPKEQIFVEKLIPLLKFGTFSTRYRDIFDLYWLIEKGNLNKKLICNYMYTLIFNTDVKINNIKEVINIITLVLNDSLFIQNLSSNVNWTGKSVTSIVDSIQKYFISLKIFNSKNIIKFPF